MPLLALLAVAGCRPGATPDPDLSTLAGPGAEPRPARSAPTGGPAQCAAWHCNDDPSAPLAWTRPGGAASGLLDLASTGDLCPRHARKAPFVLAGRFFCTMGLIPALLAGYVVFRVLYVVDQHGPGLLALFGDRWGRPVLSGVPVLGVFAWLVIFVVRAW